VRSRYRSYKRAASRLLQSRLTGEPRHPPGLGSRPRKGCRGGSYLERMQDLMRRRDSTNNLLATDVEAPPNRGNEGHGTTPPLKDIMSNITNHTRPGWGLPPSTPRDQAAKAGWPKARGQREMAVFNTPTSRSRWGKAKPLRSALTEIVIRGTLSEDTRGLLGTARLLAAHVQRRLNPPGLFSCFFSTNHQPVQRRNRNWKLEP